MECVSIYTVATLYGVPAISIKGISNNEVLDESYDDGVRKKTSRICTKNFREKYIFIKQLK